MNIFEKLQAMAEVYERKAAAIRLTMDDFKIAETKRAGKQLGGKLGYAIGMREAVSTNGHRESVTRGVGKRGPDKGPRRRSPGRVRKTKPVKAKGHYSDRVLAYVKTHPGLTASAIAKALKIPTTQTVDSALVRARNRGQVAKTGSTWSWGGFSKASHIPRNSKKNPQPWGTFGWQRAYDFMEAKDGSATMKEMMEAKVGKSQAAIITSMANHKATFKRVGPGEYAIKNPIPAEQRV